MKSLFLTDPTQLLLWANPNVVCKYFLGLNLKRKTTQQERQIIVNKEMISLETAADCYIFWVGYHNSLVE